MALLLAWQVLVSDGLVISRSWSGAAKKPCIITGMNGYVVSRQGALHYLKVFATLTNLIDEQLGLAAGGAPGQLRLLALGGHPNHHWVKHNWTQPSIRVAGRGAEMRRRR